MSSPVSVSSTESHAKSRRALLAGAIGGLGAWAAVAVGRASPARAEGENIQVGGEYTTATSRTRVRNDANAAWVFQAESSGAGVGLYGASGSHTGVYGFCGSGTGVLGQSGSQGTGVHGSSANRGVLGESSAGEGVRGQTTSGVGLFGAAATGFALRTDGRAKFSTSGVATIAAGNTSILVDPGVNVTTSSFVLLTPRANIGSRALWFTTNASTNRFTIRMSSTRSIGTKVAWLLLG